MSDEIKHAWDNGYEAGLSQGRADERKELLGGEPDGFVCYWKGKLQDQSFHVESEDAVGYVHKLQRDFQDGVDDGNWQIVPVKILKMEG